MPNKYNQRYEDQIVLMAQNKVESGVYKVFDKDARVITQKDFPELEKEVKTQGEKCLIVCNREGETMIITHEFAHQNIQTETVFPGISWSYSENTC